MSTDNRTIINDCEANTGWSGSDTASTTSLAGLFFQGSGALSTQYSNTQENMLTIEDSVATGVFSLDWSDSTLYMLIKDNLPIVYSPDGGLQFVVGDGTNVIGYDIGGIDARGVILALGYATLRLDVSVVVASPPSNVQVILGDEASLDQTACTQIGYGGEHASKAQGAIDNAFMDCFRYIANDSYAMTVNGGTAGTPLDMTDLAAADISGGWGMVANPLGKQYVFAAPTQWGNPTTVAEHAFVAANEQWFLAGDNSGGHAIGVGHFPFRVTGNATDDGSFIILGVVVVSTGTPAQFDFSNTDIDVLEVDACSFTDLADIEAPSSGGTSRFMTNCVFAGCGQITHNGADMGGCTIGGYEGADNSSALAYNEATDPDGEMDDMSFVQGTAATHAIEFGLDIPSAITLRGMDFVGYSASDANDGSVFHFLDTGGTITVNLIDCTAPAGFTFRTEGAAIDLVIAPVATKITIETPDGTMIEDARVFVETADDGGGGGFPFEATVASLVQVAGVATLTADDPHGMSTNDYMVLRGATTQHYNRTAQITEISPTVFEYPVDTGAAATATGTPVFSYMPLSGLTDVNGEITSSKSWPASQGLKGWARKSTSSPLYQQTAISITDASGGTDLLLALQSDE